MSKHYGDVAFTDRVRAAQAHYNGGRVAAQVGDISQNTGDPLTSQERAFLSERDSFYIASVSESGWPYVQYRGGPPGFLRVIDEHTLGWADFRGNRQYVTTGNVATDNRVALIVMDYLAQRRLKIFGRAQVADVRGHLDDAGSLIDRNYEATVERSVLISVVAFDWNCPQHIVPRFTAAEIEPHVTALRAQVSELLNENAALRRELRMTSANHPGDAVLDE